MRDAEVRRRKEAEARATAAAEAKARVEAKAREEREVKARAEADERLRRRAEETARADAAAAVLEESASALEERWRAELAKTPETPPPPIVALPPPPPPPSSRLLPSSSQSPPLEASSSRSSCDLVRLDLTKELAKESLALPAHLDLAGYIDADLERIEACTIAAARALQLRSHATARIRGRILAHAHPKAVLGHAVSVHYGI